MRQFPVRKLSVFEAKPTYSRPSLKSPSTDAGKEVRKSALGNTYISCCFPCGHIWSWHKETCPKSSIRPFNKFLHHRGHHRILASKSSAISAMSTYVNICQPCATQQASMESMDHGVYHSAACLSLFNSGSSALKIHSKRLAAVHHGATLLALRCGNCHIIHYQQRYQQGNMFKDICV